MNLDYESWCNAFCPELQGPLCEEFDQLFGSGCFFQVGSWMLVLTTFIIQDRFNPPAQRDDGLPKEDNKTCIHSALTMGEGMRQKLWTIITARLQSLVLEDLHLKDEIMGQGDNQTIIVSTPPYSSKTQPDILSWKSQELMAKKQD